MMNLLHRVKRRGEPLLNLCAVRQSRHPERGFHGDAKARLNS